MQNPIGPLKRSTSQKRYWLYLGSIVLVFVSVVFLKKMVTI